MKHYMGLHVYTYKKEQYVYGKHIASYYVGGRPFLPRKPEFTHLCF